MTTARRSHRASWEVNAGRLGNHSMISAQYKEQGETPAVDEEKDKSRRPDQDTSIPCIALLP